MKKGRGLKIGVVGLGVMGRHHARIASIWLKNGHLAAVADVNEQAGQEISRLYKADYYKNYQEIFPLVDALIIATPTATHRDIASEAIKAKLPILVEKPLAANAAEAQELAEIAKNNNVLVAVGMIERFNPAFVELVKLVSQEKIIGIDIKRQSPFAERITDADVVFDVMIHDLDLMMSLLAKDELESVKAQGKRVKSQKLDIVNATFFFRSGNIVKVEANRVFGSKTRKITVATERALYEADLLNKTVIMRTMEHPAPSSHFTKSYDQLTAEQQDFVFAIKRGRQPKVSAQAGLRCIKLAEEVQKACS